MTKRYVVFLFGLSGMFKVIVTAYNGVEARRSAMQQNPGAEFLECVEVAE